MAATLEDMDAQLGININVEPVRYWFEMFREIKRVTAAGGEVKHLLDDLEEVLPKNASSVIVHKVTKAVGQGIQPNPVSDHLGVLNYEDDNRIYPNEKSILCKQYLSSRKI